ncbi:MAG: hypothetical protein HY664_08175 [Chloroflexi bacterium]|nr:hypothetical protein [Chloroflexota bacterium]
MAPHVGAKVYFVGDRMFAFATDEGLVTKLPEPQRTQALAEGEAQPFMHGGRSFGAWVLVPVSNPSQLAKAQTWARLGYKHVSVIPPVRRRSPGRRWQAKQKVVWQQHD